MSKTVDERVVSMQFDNKHFEKNVATTISTLDKLKQSLKLDGASKGLENVSTAAKKFDASPMANGVETIRMKFSALEVMAMTVLSNITNSALNAGKRIASALTIEPIKSGFQEYETQINAVQTILANTSTKGTTLDQVNNALDELNHYADKTIYNFTEMTRNIGTFTAAGVDLDTSVSAIQGIANLAAVSGSNSQQASTAMYQLSQALAAGTVKLMDWNSVVNAGMGGEIFQNALKETSRLLGTGADAAIKANGSFRESLQTGWLTSEVLTETLKKFTTSGANEYVAEYTGLSQEAVEAALKDAEAKYGEADAIDKASQALAEKSGKNKDEIKSVLEMARTSEDAATKVKTFTQLIDTTKEALQSGWTQTWEILIGNFEEAKTLWTSASDYLGEVINKSAEARNNMLQAWSDGGGRTMAIEAITNTFKGLLDIMKPVKEAFREVFPPMTAENLLKITKSIRDLTEKFKLTDDQSAKLKSTFKGLFSLVDIGLTGIKELAGGAVKLLGSFSGLGGGILDVTSSFGEWASELRDSVKETDFFGKAIDKVVGFISKFISKIKDFGSSVKENLNGSYFNGFMDFLKSLASFSKQIGSVVIDTLSNIGKSIANLFGESNFFEVLNNGLFAGILAYIVKFFKNMSGAFEEGVGVLENVKGILDDVRGCFEAYQNNLKAGTLLKIASAIGILAASIFVISTIDGDSLLQSLTAITVLFGELMGSLAIFNKMSVNLKGVTKTITMMIGMSAAILILSGAMKRLADLDWNGLAKGLVGVLGLTSILVGAARVMDTNSKSITKFAGQMVIMSAAIGILTVVAKQLSSMSWEELLKSGTGILGITTILVSAAKIMDSDSKAITKFGGQMLLMSASIGVLSLVAKQLSSMSWEELGKAGAGILGLTTMLVAAAKIMDSGNKSITKFGGQMLLMSASLAILTPVLKSLGGMSWDEIGRGLTVMGIALAELAIGLNAMTGTLSGSAAMIIASTALAILTPVLQSLGSMSVGEIAKSLITLAGAFAIIGVAGYLLAPLIPAILGLSAAFALFGVSMIGIGAGLALIGVGLTSIAAAGTAAAASLVASITIIVTGILDLIPTITNKLSEAIIAFCQVIGTCAPAIAEALLALVTSALDSLSTHVPEMVSSLLTLFIGVINSFADHLPELITATVNLIGKFFQGIVDALNGIDTTNLLKGIIAVGLLSGLMFALSAVVGVIPSAMLGVVGVGAVVAELALVLAAIGGLAQIPGLPWLIGEGGNLLQKIGTAIGQFVGGIIGGVAQGVTSSLPKIASDLSSFMKNIKPFIDGAKSIDSSAMDGVKSLAKAILVITAADILSGITSWITGGSSMSDFAEQIVPFGKAMKEYSDEVEGIDSQAVKSSASAGKTLAELANNLPNSGGLAAFFAGENDLEEFTNQIVPFGKAMKEYGDEVKGLDADAVTSSATAAKALSELAENLPNSGGVVGFFAGENDLIDFAEQLVPFGKAMKDYSDGIKGLDSDAVTNSATAAKSLAELANNLPNSGGVSGFFAGENDLVDFTKQLAPFGESMKAYADSISGIDIDAVTNSASAGMALSELANSIDNTGGLVTLLKGDNSLLSFAGQLVPFGLSMKAYAKSIEGIDSTAIEASAAAGESLAELAKNLPKANTIITMFSDNNSLTSFGLQLVPFGKCLKSYSDSIKGIDTEAVTSSANGATALSELANNLSNTGGIISLFTGDNDLATFGSQLAPFGKAMKDYADNVTGIDTEAVTNSATAAEALTKVAQNIQNGGIVSLFTGEGNIAGFSTQLAPFGKGLKDYSDSVIGLNVDAVTNSATAAKALSEVANSIKGGGIVSLFTGEGNITSLTTQLGPFGTALKAYGDNVSGINLEAITNSVTGAKDIISVINDTAGINTTGVLPFVEALNTLGTTSIDSFVSSFENAGERVSTAVSSMMNAMTNAVNSQKGKLTTAFVTAVDVSVTSISAKQGQFRSSGVIIMTGLITGVSSQKGRLISVTTSLILATISAIMQKQPMFIQAGIVVMTGFAGGISSCQQTSIDSVNLVLDSCIQAINDNYQDFYDAGEYLGDGLIAGIEAKEQAAYDAGYALGQAAVRGEKDGQQSHSPSKATIKAGKWLGEGLVIGMQQMSRSVYNAGGSMGEQAVDSISNALEYVSSLSETDLDIQPAIRPVVDMSGLSANGISLSSSIDLSLTKPIDSLSEIVSKAQAEITASNLEVVNAINGLREDLNNMADDQEVSLYVDSKKLASTLAKPMNRELHVLYKRGAY